ncbi:unnamed protein product [Anisakis simplex]|uniref:Uncharacterized protein n=1 Tax=Anisakis simplex TaxID=6269 RepID=A0A3P6PDC3_ANISI|nr:unnamed protein product [Anisakis simplex]
MCRYRLNVQYEWGEFESVDRVFVFNSKMANEAIGGVQENKYESIVAWHEANCQPSTSTAPQQNQFILNDSQPQQQPQPIKTKRKSNFVKVKEFQQEMRLRSPSSTNGIAPPPPVSGMSVTSSNSPITSRPESSTSSRNIDSSRFISPSNYEQLSEKNNPPTSSSDLLMPNDDVDINSDNPLRRMERMTQDSLFEPPSKVIRTTSNENSHPARRDQERNAKLEKMRTLEQQILIDKARSEWDRMVHEHEAIKMAQNGCVAAVAYQQQMIQRQHRAAPPIAAYPQPPLPSPVSSQYPVAQPHMIGPPAVAAAAPPPHMQHPAYRRPSYPPQQIPPSQGLSPIAPQNGTTAAMMNGGGIPVSAPPGMPMSQPLRPSLNPPPYSLHLPPDGGYMSCGGYPSNVAIPSQGYPPPPANMSSPTVSPAYSPMYPPMNPNPMPPRGYPVYPQQGMRPVYADKMMAPEMWPQQFPQPLGNLEARIPSQKIQYHPNGTVLDDGMGENIVNMNQMYG